MLASIKKTNELSFLIFKKYLDSDFINSNIKLMKQVLDEHHFKLFYSETNLIRFTLSPFLLCKEDDSEVDNVSQKMTALLEKVITAYVSGDKSLRNFFLSYEPFLSFFKKISGKWLTIARYDFLIDEGGVIKFNEFNTSSPGGNLLTEVIQGYTKKYLIAKKILSRNIFPQEYEAKGFFSNYLLNLARSSPVQDGIIALLYDANKVQLELHEMKYLLNQVGEEVIVESVEKLSYHDGRLYLNKRPVKLIYNNFFFHGDALKFNQKGPWWDDPNRYLTDHLYSAFFRGVKDSGCVLAIGFPAMTIVEDKSIFCVFHDEQFSHLFNSEEMRFIKKHIPYSKKLTIDMLKNEAELSELISNKNNLVLKISYSALGKGIFMGNEFPPKKWESLLRKHVENALIQERIHGQKHRIIECSLDRKASLKEMNAAVSMYNYSGKYCGCLCRVSESNIANYENGLFQPVIKIDD